MPHLATQKTTLLYCKVHLMLVHFRQNMQLPTVNSITKTAIFFSATNGSR